MTPVDSLKPAQQVAEELVGSPRGGTPFIRIDGWTCWCGDGADIAAADRFWMRPKDTFGFTCVNGHVHRFEIKADVG